MPKHILAKNRERAEEHLDKASLLIKHDGNLIPIVDILCTRARIHLELGNELLEAENLFVQAIIEAERFGTPWHGMMISTDLARLAPQTGKVREAHDRLAAYYASLTEGFDRAPAREAKAALSELAAILERGDA